MNIGFPLFPGNSRTSFFLGFRKRFGSKQFHRSGSQDRGDPDERGQIRNALSRLDHGVGRLRHSKFVGDLHLGHAQCCAAGGDVVAKGTMGSGCGCHEPTIQRLLFVSRSDAAAQWLDGSS